MGVTLFFCQKLLNTQHGVGRCANKSPMKWANALKESSKKFTEAKGSLSRKRPAGTLIQMGSWNTYLEGEACITRGPLYRIQFQVFWGPPLCLDYYLRGGF